MSLSTKAEALNLGDIIDTILERKEMHIPQDTISGIVLFCNEASDENGKIDREGFKDIMQKIKTIDTSENPKVRKES